MVEAAALGHDLGHTPFDHQDEKIFNEISLENYGKGLNITLQTLDAIMCHNGEFLLGKYFPREKTIKEFFDEYKKTYTDKNTIKTLRPMTLEGCVVRISDMIVYLGRDIDDARKFRLIKRKEISENIVKVLGSTTKEMVNTIVMDIINNSKRKKYIELSNEVFNSMVELKKLIMKKYIVKHIH